MSLHDSNNKVTLTQPFLTIQKQEKVATESKVPDVTKKTAQETNATYWKTLGMQKKQELALLIRPKIACNSYYTVFTLLDGTLFVIIRRRSTATEVLLKWTNIVAVAAGYSDIYGLRSNGVLISVEADSGRRHYHDSNIVAISKQGRSIYQRAETRYTLLGAPQNAGKDVAAVSEGSEFYAILRNNGTVFTWKKDKYHYDFEAAIAHLDDKIPDGSTWRNIVSIDAGRDHLVGLKADGSVVASGNNEYGQCNVSHWENIIAIAAGENHTVGVTAQGKVLTVGSNEQGQCKVAEWESVVSVVAMGNNTIGVKADGRVLGTGEYIGYGFRYDCKLFNCIDTLIEDSRQATERMRLDEQKRALMGPSKKEIELNRLEQQYEEARCQENEVDKKRTQVRGLFKKKKLKELRDEWYKYSGIASNLSGKINQLKADINHNWED